jgi:hypothetical protein
MSNTFLVYTAYLFVYFTGNSGTEEAIRFATGYDGYTWRALNSNNPVIASDTISEMKGVRDPHILRCEDGQTFYMVVTDMKSANGWNSNHGIVLLQSTDLVNWTHSRVDIAARFPQFATINRAWAPQTIYDPEAGKYMVYWSMRSGSDRDVIYYSYANDGFTDLETSPKVLFNYPTSTIDGDIVYLDGKYHLFFKTEGNGNGIKKAVANTLTGNYSVQDDRYLQQTTNAVEGSCVFKLFDSDTWILMYDMYTSGAYQFTESTDLSNFELTQKTVSMNFSPRHGTAIPITAEEASRLANKWATSGADYYIGYYDSEQVRKDNVFVKSLNMHLPVRYGTDLTAFDPQMRPLMPGITITPSGPQDFTQGAIPYRIASGAVTASRTFQVSARVDNNPVLDGFHADPQILYSRKTGKYYLYPTSDGFDGWGGYCFKAFSSDNLVEWKDEGVILDLSTDQVPWANGNAWAPAIVEKEIDGEYRYFFYFSGNPTAGGGKQIGVAVAASPAGPFVDSGKPLITTSPTGSGQQIDPCVFSDPVSGKCYIYWGNGYMAGAELNDDMLSIQPGTTKVMTPNATFREGAYVIYRNGRYYFFWSEDDTGSENYKVRYGTSSAPLGKISVPANNIVIQKDAEREIYATGHNSILQIPDRDEWYIVYHRFRRPRMDNPGNHREVCIDRLLFNADGTIQPVTPTLEGISPLGTTEATDPVSSSRKPSLTVFPNPVKDRLYFAMNEKNGEPVHVRIADIAGRTHLKKQAAQNEESIDCKHLPQGCYLLNIQQGTKLFTTKFGKIDY